MATFKKKIRQNAQIVKSRVSVSNFKSRVSVSEFLMESQSRRFIQVTVSAMTCNALHVIGIGLEGYSLDYLTTSYYKVIPTLFQHFCYQVI